MSKEKNHFEMFRETANDTFKSDDEFMNAG